jgi:hypothetical protein
MMMRLATAALVLAACGRVAPDGDDAGISDASIDVGVCTLSAPQKMFEASNAEFLGLAIRAADVLFIDNGTLTSLAKDSNDAGDAVALAPCEAFAVDGALVFCLTKDLHLSRLNADASVTDMSALPGINNGRWTIVAGDGRVYVSDSSTIWSFGEVTASESMLTSAPSVWLDAFVDGAVYWRSDVGGYDNPIVLFNTTNASTHVTTTLTTVQLETRRMKLNSSTIYFAAYDPHAPTYTSTPMSLFAVPRTGGDASAIITNLYDTDFAVDDAMIVAGGQNGPTKYALSGNVIGPSGYDELMTFATFDGAYIYTITDGDLGAWLSRSCR